MKRAMAILFALWLGFMGGIPPVFRLHVIANSDSAQDQAVKLVVRDAIIQKLGDMNQAEDSQQAEAYASEHLAELVDTANQVLAQQGMAYQAKASIGTYPFPEKTYGSVTLPAGDYRALRIQLGQAEGQNWWCILFPPLCLVETGQIEENWQIDQGVTYESFFAKLFR